MQDHDQRWSDTLASGRVAAGNITGFAVIALAVFWTGFVLLYTARAALLGSNPLDNMLPRILVAVFGAGISWLLYALLERLRPRSIMSAMAMAASVSIPASIVFAVGHEMIFTPLAVNTGSACASFPGGTCPPPDMWEAIVNNTVNWTFLFTAWSLVQLAARSTLERWAADNRASEQREATRVAEIRALRYQVNPHFLFNCLNSLATLARRPDPTEAVEMIAELGTFLRYGLATDLLTDVDLKDEIDIQQRYLALECRRFSHRLTVEVEIEPAAERARVPSLILQPLVENAIRHGVAMTIAQSVVAIRARVTPDRRLLLVVEDDAWAGENGQSETGFGIGLRNVSARLAARYGQEAVCRTTHIPLGGFRAELDMPLTEA